MGWNPVKSFTGFLSDTARSARNITKGAGVGSLFGPAGQLIGAKKGMDVNAAEKSADAFAAASNAAKKAAHDAEVARLAENSIGAVAMRRRKGMYASMFTGTPSLSTPNAGKTLLSQ